MSNLKISEIISPHVSGNSEFSARKIRSGEFGGLLDPVIGFDHFQLTNDVFGAHPHAGMSAISYVFDDSVPYHSLDSRGNDVLVTPGSLLWTWAGSGVVHTEYPVPDGARVNGLQMFVTIPADEQQQAPQSIFIDKDEMPLITTEGVKVKVVSGVSGTTGNPVVTPNPLTILHIWLADGKSFSHQLPAGWNGTIYTIEGRNDLETSAGKLLLHSGSVIALGSSNLAETINFTAHVETQLILISGAPLKQAVFSSGAMSMSSAEKLAQATADYRSGKMGYVEIQGTTRKVILPV
ncbi:pirin family protein [Mucilaginibacter gynuensis]|uniref:Pirin family protein n=1 Tax=Mucilaginibacter gynuensis TaxID=1302236 RepID=A0ABP8GGA0_9SPHI